MLSITIRPRYENFTEEFLPQIQELFNQPKHNYKYIIGKEKGESQSDYNHLQISVYTKKRTDKMRELITRCLSFTPSDEAEANRWLVLKSVKPQDFKYTVGYCMKEDDFVSNISTEELNECQEEYNRLSDLANEAKNPNPKRYLTTSINTLLPTVHTFATEHSLINRDLRTICSLMVALGFLPLSLVNKLKKANEQDWLIYKEVQNYKGETQTYDFILNSASNRDINRFGNNSLTDYLETE